MEVVASANLAVRFALEVGALAALACAAGLALAGRPRLGAAFAAAAVLNSVLDRALGL